MHSIRAGRDVAIARNSKAAKGERASERGEVETLRISRIRREEARKLFLRHTVFVASFADTPDNFNDNTRSLSLFSLLFLSFFSFSPVCNRASAHALSRTRENMNHRRYRANAGDTARKHRLRRCTRVRACPVLHIRGYLFRLCSADQSIDEQACRLRTCLLLHACTLPICDDLLRDPFAMPVSGWWRAGFLLYARERAFYESRESVFIVIGMPRVRSPKSIARTRARREKSLPESRREIASKDVLIPRAFFRRLSRGRLLSHLGKRGKKRCDATE